MWRAQKSVRRTAAEAINDKIYKAFNLDTIIDKELFYRSGEMRKFQLTKSLLSCPKVVIMDNPFIGLDAPSRLLLQELLADLAATQELQIILILSRADEIPPFVTHVFEMNQMVCSPKYTIDEYTSLIANREIKVDETQIEEMISQLAVKPTMNDTIVEMDSVSIQYGPKVILNNVNLTIRKGEKWAITGRNGSGKSTLLSLICADNPQSYACSISLFGRKRGTGESIWDIKREIGYKAEMHRSTAREPPP